MVATPRYWRPITAQTPAARRAPTHPAAQIDFLRFLMTLQIPLSDSPSPNRNEKSSTRVVWGCVGTYGEIMPLLGSLESDIGWAPPFAELVFFHDERFNTDLPPDTK